MRRAKRVALRAAVSGKELSINFGGLRSVLRVVVSLWFNYSLLECYRALPRRHNGTTTGKRVCGGNTV